jgi:hypothetical protein
MDSVLIDYLRSGRAWVLVGSGPSIQSGQPTWRQLAESALLTVKTSRPDVDLAPLESAFASSAYPELFEKGREILGWPTLLDTLRSRLNQGQRQTSRSIYEQLARWPVSVYLTTNYDDEIQTHLAKAQVNYIPYTNSEDHFGELLETTSGAIFKLHGDLRSKDGLVLTASQYRHIAEGSEWSYWRTKLTSVFQMVPVVIVGHSLTDPHVRHVLAAAKLGAGVKQPVIWLAPDVAPGDTRRYLEEFRIRVIPYSNQDGRHNQLFRLLKNVTLFVPPRESIGVRRHIDMALGSSSFHEQPGATGLFVFSKLVSQPEFEDRRSEVVLAALESVVPELKAPFTLSEALAAAGWPSDVALPDEMRLRVEKRAIASELLRAVDGRFVAGAKAEDSKHAHRFEFDHLRETFKSSIVSRALRDYPDLSDTEAGEIAAAVESSLVGYFRAGGLTLASTLFGRRQQAGSTPMPRSVVRFVNEASAKFADYLKRQAFFTLSIDIFVEPEQAEREYVGRLAQGYLAFHILGVFGDAANERLAHAQDTVWIVDSDVLIPVLAVGAATQPAVLNTVQRLGKLGVQLYATESLFEEAFDHLFFATKVVDRFGVDSPDFFSAAKGDTPYRNSNQFLEGFVNWRSTTGSSDWSGYLYAAFGDRRPSGKVVKKKLEQLGIRVVGFQAWPGHETDDLTQRLEYERQIADMRLHPERSDTDELSAEIVDRAFRKAGPEAEAFVIVSQERAGRFHMLSEADESSPCWFVSHTSILNTLGDSPITWQPEAFMAFAETLAPQTTAESANQAFDLVVWSVAEAGQSMLDERTVAVVLGDRVEEAALNLGEQRQQYEATLATKYGESVEAVLKRVPPSRRPLVAVQLANEVAQVEATKRLRAELAAAEAIRLATTRADEALRRAKAAEKRLGQLEALGRKLDRRQGKAKKRRAKQKSGKTRKR